MAKKKKKPSKKVTSKQLVAPLKGAASSLKNASSAMKLASRNLEKSIKILCEQTVTWTKQSPVKKTKKARKK
jgi:hypothetical protein